MTLSKAFARIFWSISMLLAVIAFVFAIVQIVRLTSAEELEGHFLGYRTTQNQIPYTEEDSGMLYYPTIEYQGDDEQSLQFTSRLPVSKDAYTIGETIAILKLRNGTMLIQTFMGVWGGVVVLLGTAVLFGIFGFGALKSFDSKTY